MAQANVILSKKSLEENEELLTCSICKEIFTNPKQLPCVHSFCKQCLDGMTNDTSCSLRCPVCRREFRLESDGTSALEDDEYLRNLSDVYKAKKTEDATIPIECSICKESTQSEHISHCLECDDNLCIKCKYDHSKFQKLTHSHTVVALQEVACGDSVLNRSKSLCKKHPNRIMELFCFSCRECICLECLNQHLKKKETNCDITTLPVNREMLMATWSKQVEYLEDIIKVYEEELARATRVQQNIHESREKVREEIQAESDRLIVAIQENTKKTLASLDEASKTDEKVAALHCEKAEAAIQACKHMLKIREHVAKNGKDVEVVPVLNGLEKQLEYFKQPVDYLNIEGKFEFHPDNHINIGTLYRMTNDEPIWDFNELKSGDKVQRGKTWELRGDDYRYRTGKIVSKQQPNSNILWPTGLVSSGFNFGSPTEQKPPSWSIDVLWGDQLKAMRFKWKTKSVVPCQVVPVSNQLCEIPH